jgi:hypothetical protein
VSSELHKVQSDLDEMDDMMFPVPPPDVLPRLSVAETRALCAAASEEFQADPSQSVTIWELFDELMAIDGGLSGVRLSP